MAFGKKYYSSYKSNNDLDYYLEIWVNGWVKPEVEMTMAEGGPVIEYETDQEDRFSPILSSSCKIPFLVQDNDERLFINNLRTLYQEREIYIHIYRATSSTYQSVAPLWSGFCVMDIGKGLDQAFPYVQELKFVDGLSLLKDIDFVDLDVTGGTPPFNERVQGNYATENMYYGPATYIFWFREILKKTGASLSGANGQGVTQDYGFTTCINWYNGDMDNTGQSEDPLEKTKCQVSMFHRKDDQGVYFPENCYTVLKELLRHWGARITYWKHEFWIVQIPEYITGESGTIDNPQNNFSRLYSDTGAFLGSQDHLGSTYWTRYFQEISNEKISKLTGTTYDYLPIIKQVNAKFLSFESENYYGGFPFGSNPLDQEVFQGTINSPSTSDFLWLSIPLDWTWDCPNFSLGHTAGWWSSIKFNFYASDGTTTYYLQYDGSSQTLPYYWIDSSNWTPLGPRSPRYTISSKSLSVTAHVGFEQSIPFKDENGNAITMSGAWSFFLDLEKVGTTSGYGNSGSNPGCFYLNFSGYGSPQRMRNPNVGIILPTLSGPLNSGTVSWSNSLEDPAGQINISTISNPAGFNAGTIIDDIRFATTSPFLGLLQTLTNGQSSSYGETFNTINDTSAETKANSEQFNFGQLLWGDSIEFARSSLQVDDGTDYVNTNSSGLWGVGTLTGTKTFTQLLIDEFLYGQTKIVITPTMRLAVGVANKNQTEGTATRPRYVNPIGKLRETRETADPEYIFRRGKFYTLLDEWDYEGYQIIRNVVSTSNQNNNIGNLGGNQLNAPNNSAMLINPVSQALAQNSPIAYLSATIPSTGSNVAVNGNFNVATGWTLGTGWSIDTTAKKANFTATGSTSDLVQSVLTEELTYQINFKVVVTAGTLLVKAGTTGTTETITSSGDYSIYLTCEGSSDIKFQAGTTFTGSITYITLRDQKSLSSVPINAIGTAVFKTGDTFNLINSNDDQPLALTVTSNQGSTDTSISVSSTPLYADIDAGSYLLINQEDLSAQYQNKTKGTVGGFDITATSIDSGSVAISSYIDDDSFGTASATSLATSESIKAYVDTQVGSADTLQEVTDLGNTTTNSIMIGSSSTPQGELHIVGQSGSQARIYVSDVDVGVGATDSLLITKSGSTSYIYNRDSNSSLYLGANDVSNVLVITNNSNVLIGTTTDDGSSKLQVTGDIKTSGNVVIPYDGFLKTSNNNMNFIELYNGSDASMIFRMGHPTVGRFQFLNSSDTEVFTIDARNERVGIGTTSPSLKLDVIGNYDATPVKFLRHATYGNIIRLGRNGVSETAHIGYPADATLNFSTGGSERMRLTSGGNLLIGDTSNVDEGKLQVFGDINIRNANGSNPTDAGSLYFGETGGVWGTSLYGFRINLDGSANNLQIQSAATSTVKTIISMQRDTGVVTLGYGLTGTTATFSGQVTIPATPVASTDAASKSYVDAQVGTADTLQEVTDLGNTTTNSIMIGSSSSPSSTLDVHGAITLSDTVPNSINSVVNLTLNADSDSNSGDAYRNIIFQNRGSEKMRLTSGGNLYVGTTSGSEKLSVSGGNIAVTNGAGILVGGAVGDTKIGKLYNVSGVLSLDGDGTRSIRFGSTSNGEVMRVDNTNQRIGIGTSSPNVPLEVNGNARFGDSSTGVAFGIVSTDVYQISGADTGFTGWNSLHFKADGNDGLFIEKDTNNIGINTDSPTEKLHVVGDALITGDSHADAFKPAVSGNPIKFKNFDSSTEFARITDDGYLGLGVTSPNAIMQISGTSPSGRALHITDNKTSKSNGTYTLQVDSSAHTSNMSAAGAFNVEVNSGNAFTIAGNGSSTFGYNVTVGGTLYYNGNLRSVSPSKLILYNNSDKTEIHSAGTTGILFKDNSNNERARITSGGNVLIGTTTDSGQKLQVNGDIKIGDSNHLLIGTSSDLDLYHTGTNSFVENWTGDLYIRNNSNDKDIIFQSDDGSGGITSYITLDGSQTTINLEKNVLIGTTTDNNSRLRILGATSDTTKSALEVRNSSSTALFSIRNDGRIDASGPVNLTGSLTGTTATFSGATDQILNLNSTDSNAVFMAFKRANSRIGYFGFSDTSNNINIGNETTSGKIRFVTNSTTKMSLEANGNLLIGTTTDSGFYKLDVNGKQRVQSVLELDDVLTLNAISTPSDPANNKSSIYMDSADGSIKVKINVGGTVVTRTIASFE